jgi:hypothetical protein
VKHSFLCAALFAGLFIAFDETAAVEVAIGDTTIEAVAPTGHCPLDRRSWPESQLIDFTSSGIRKQGERLAYFVDCERARSWNEGGSSKNEGDVIDYQASLEFGDQNVTSTMLEGLCAALRKHDDTNTGWLDMFLRAIKSAFKAKYGADDSTLTFIVIGYENAACYVFRASLMQDREQVHTVSVLTTLKGKLVAAHHSRRFGSMDLLKGKTEDAIKHLLAISHETATALTAANQ